ncbi:hypothetical protein CEXT_637241 [Caerostris extrusa]|uniref:Uncharacterized protein n=1 Tax=Caerostris extrusa TaxID=172846 RepID=A0AAV4Y6T2_CAEEX|nr:hypothetical protein CEXT_637241 [Caerostris extrusa]
MRKQKFQKNSFPGYSDVLFGTRFVIVVMRFRQVMVITWNIGQTILLLFSSRGVLLGVPLHKNLMPIDWHHEMLIPIVLAVSESLYKWRAICEMVASNLIMFMIRF